MPTNPKKHFSILAAILIAALSGILLYFTRLNLLYSYLLSLNIITFLIYGYDKHQARENGMRIALLRPQT
jgi:carbon starvation protein CstA